ncbi:zinc finger, CCHC-type containing protein [Tanacetum coccineum]
MMEHNNSAMYNDNKGKRKHHDTKSDPNKKSKVTCWKCRKPEHLKKDCKDEKGCNKANGSGTNGSVNDDVAWWVDSGETIHVCKDRCWETYESLNDGSILHMGNESTALVHGHVIESDKLVLSKHGVFIGFDYLSNQIFRLNVVNDNIGSAIMSTFKLNGSIIWHVRLGHVHLKRMQNMSKDGLILAFDIDTEKCKTCMLTKITKKLFQNVKRETEVLKLIYSDLCNLHATSSLGNKKYFVTFIDDASRTESRVLRVLGCMAVVRFSDPKLKTLSERGIEYIFVGYAEYSSLLVPKPSQRSLINRTEDIGGSVVPEEVVAPQPESELRKSKRNRTPKNFGPEFLL